MSVPAVTPDPAAPVRRACLVAAAALCAFTLYVSLLPFNVRPVPAAEAWARATAGLTHWPGRLPRTNFLANLLLFVPLGFSLMGARLAGRTGAPRLGTALLVAAGATVVSVSAETLQVFIPRRVVSSADVLAQALGCAIGIGAWLLVGASATSWTIAARHGLAADRPARVLAAYLVAWVLANLAPFDITLDVATLAQRVRSGAIALVPFQEPATIRVWWDATVTFVGAVPLGVAALVVGRQGAYTRRGVPAALLFVVLLAAGLETAQAFVRSHAATATDLLVTAAGGMAGVWAGARLAAPPVAGPTSAVRWAWAAMAGWALVVATYHWQPFDFAIDETLVRQKLGSLSLVPFAGYRSGSDLRALSNAIARAGLAAPMGVLFALATRGGSPGTLARTAALGAAVAFFGLIELGQVFLPTRVPDVTEVAMGVAAAAAGARLGRWAWPAQPL